MTGGTTNLQSLVVKCLDNDPTIAEVSATLKSAKTLHNRKSILESPYALNDGLMHHAVTMEHGHQTPNEVYHIHQLSHSYSYVTHLLAIASKVSY